MTVGMCLRITRWEDGTFQLAGAGVDGDVDTHVPTRSALVEELQLQAQRVATAAYRGSVQPLPEELPMEPGSSVITIQAAPDCAVLARFDGRTQWVRPGGPESNSLYYCSQWLPIAVNHALRGGAQ